MKLGIAPNAMSIERNDHQLVRDALEGDYRAFDQLIERYSPCVFRLALRMLGRREEAEDIQQECFVSAYRNLRKFRGESSFGTWVYAIASRLCLSRRRRADWRTTQALDDAPELPIASGNDPEEQLLALESAARVQRTLAKLASADRLVILLRHVEGLSHEEIAGVLKCSVAGSRARLLRAKRLFRNIYETTE